MIPEMSNDQEYVTACLIGLIVAMNLQNGNGEDDVKHISSSHAHDKTVDVLVLMFGILFLTLLLMMGLSVPLIAITGLSTLLIGERWARHRNNLTRNVNAI